MAISGKKTVTTAGTAVQLADGQRAHRVAIRALEDNTGEVYIGNSDGDISATDGYEMGPGDVIEINVPGDDLGNIWLDAGVNGEGVTWLRLS